MPYKKTNPEAELALIHALLDAPGACRAEVMGLDPDDVDDRRARELVRAYQDGEPPDRVALATAAADALGEDVTTLTAYIEDARGVDANAGEIKTYVALVEDAARNQRVIGLLNRAITEVLGGASGIKTITQVREALRDLLPRDRGETLADVAARHYDRVATYHEHPLPPGQVRGLSTGYRALDALTEGLEAAFYISGARPSVGKTALWTQVTVHAARQLQGTGKVAIYFTNEMTADQLLGRMACALSRIDRGAVRRGALSRDELARYLGVVGELQDLPLELRSVQNLHEVLARAYRDPAPGLIVVDYLNKLSGGEGTNRNQRFGYIAGALFDLALALEVPVVLLAQLNRGIEQRAADAVPLLEDLRDSGELEQIADVVLMLHRVTDDTSEYWDPRNLKVIKSKDRLNGGQGLSRNLYFGKYGEVRDGTR